MISIFCIIAGFTCCCTSIAAELIKHTKYKHLLRLRPDITVKQCDCITVGAKEMFTLLKQQKIFLAKQGIKFLISLSLLSVGGV